MNIIYFIIKQTLFRLSINKVLFRSGMAPDLEYAYEDLSLLHQAIPTSSGASLHTARFNVHYLICRAVQRSKLTASNDDHVMVAACDLVVNICFLA